MVKIALLVPNEDMLEAAREVVKERNIEVDYMKAIQTVNTVNEARMAVEAGAHIIVARGYQAKLIQKYTNIPLVEIRLHAQEIGLLLKKAKTIVRKETPRIGLVIFKNMLSDMSHIDELFGVKLLTAYLERLEDIPPRMQEISKLNPDLIIGGDSVCEEAERMGYPTIFYASTEVSIAEALLAARKMAFAADVEKQSAAQFETVLDTSFNGIIKINAEGNIIAANRQVENLIGKNAEDVIGFSVLSVFPEFEEAAVDSILSGRRENYTVSVNIRNQAWMLVMAPIQYDNIITGAILTLHRVSEVIRRNHDSIQDAYLHGFMAKTTFHDIPTGNAAMKRVLELAEQYALSERPVLINGEEGTEFYQIAEAIHNNSVRRTGPFVSVNLSEMSRERQEEMLFGRESGGEEPRRAGALVRADHGTVFLKGIEWLTTDMQFQISKLLLPHEAVRTDARPMDNLDVRIIAYARKNLMHQVQVGSFGEELFYLMQGLYLEIPPLRDRPEDLLRYFAEYLQKYLQKYNKHLVLTDGAYKQIREFAWQGNRIQMEAFCERLVLTSNKRSIDEVHLRELYGQLYPNIVEVGGQEKIVIYSSPEAADLKKLLEKYHGNRALVAKELGISTTTLWRRMKKLGVEANYKF